MQQFQKITLPFCLIAVEKNRSQAGNSAYCLQA